MVRLVTKTVVNYVGFYVINLLFCPILIKLKLSRPILVKTYITKFHTSPFSRNMFNPYPTEFPYGNGMVLHFYQQQESSTTKTVHKVINKRLKAYVLSLHTGENFH